MKTVVIKDVVTSICYMAGIWKIVVINARYKALLMNTAYCISIIINLEMLAEVTFSFISQRGRSRNKNGIYQLEERFAIVFCVECLCLFLCEMAHLKLNNFETVSSQCLQDVALHSNRVWFDYCQSSVVKNINFYQYIQIRQTPEQYFQLSNPTL